jgi:hypothetical protein
VNTPVIGADISSNNTATDSIEFDGTTVIDGNVYSGPNSTLGAIGYYGATKTGIDGALASSKDLNVLSAPGNATPFPTFDADYTAGPNVIPGGTYHVKGNLNISSGAVVSVTSTTSFYVDGNVTIDGASVNMNGYPWHFQIFMTGGAGVANITNSSTSILLSGPDSDISVRDSELFGALIGNRVFVLDSGIHYDRAVNGLYLGSTSWVTDVFLNSATTKELAVTPPSGGPPSDPLANQPALPGPTSPPSTPPSPGAPPPTGSPLPQPAPPPQSPPPSPPPSFIDNPQCCLDYSCGPPMCHLY